jgi:flagellar hook-length control protein FliK
MIDNAIRALAVAPTAASPATPPGRAPQARPATHPFADLLRQNQAAARASPVSPGPQAQKSDERPARSDTTHTDESTPADAAAPRHDAARAKARSAGAAPAEPAAEPQAATPSADTASDETRAHPGEAKDGVSAAPDAIQIAPACAGTVAGTLAGALASASPDVATRIAAEAVDGADDARGEAPFAANASRSRVAASDGQGAGMLPLDASSAQGALAGTAAERRAAIAGTDGHAASSGDAGAASTPDGAAASFAGMPAESKASEAATRPSAADHAPGDAAATVQPGAVVGSVAPSPSSALAAAALPVAVHSPDFATAFGLQVSALAKDGVQRAELHLNPTEMGPVSIHITLDGSQARVDFGADTAATRHAIEAGLPELASALRDAGFTLAGGGVAQHPGSSGSGSGSSDAEADRAAASRGASGDSPPDANAQRATRRIAAGGVDVYA